MYICSLCSPLSCLLSRKPTFTTSLPPAGLQLVSEINAEYLHSILTSVQSICISPPHTVSSRGFIYTYWVDSQQFPCFKSLEKGYGDDEVDRKIVDLGTCSLSTHPPVYLVNLVSDKGENFSPSFLRLNAQGLGNIQCDAQFEFDNMYQHLYQL
jgi:hypothetical protein